MIDVIIIGGGPAGITASLYTKRGNLNTLVLYNEESTIGKAHKIENYYGFKDSISGEELYEIGIKQAKNIGVQVKREEAIKVEFNDKNFKVITDRNIYISKALILATGNRKNTPNIKGIKEFEGRGVSYCAICDGFFYKNKNVAVLGNGKYAIAEMEDLIHIAKNITILTNGEHPEEYRSDNVKINTKGIKELRGNEMLEQIQFNDNTSIKVDGIFIAQGIATSTDFAKKLGILIKDNNILVNEYMETNVPGIFACGDCTGGLLQISKSVYEGTKAGLQVVKYLKDKN